MAQHADAWHTFGNLDTLVRKSTVLDELAASAGRDPASILRAASLDLSQPIDSIRRDADERRAAGFGYLICGWPGEGRGRVEEFVDTVLPEITSN